MGGNEQIHSGLTMAAPGRGLVKQGAGPSNRYPEHSECTVQPEPS